MTGTPSQVEWAELIKPRVHAEFERVAQAFRGVSGHQTGRQRSDTLAVVALVEEKCEEVMRHTEAGYFIKNWQDLSDQVRVMLAAEPRYQAIKEARTTG